MSVIGKIKYHFSNETLRAPEASGDSFTIVSYNARCLAKSDKGERSWFVRAPLFLQTVKSLLPDLFCAQEITRTHFRYLSSRLKDYGVVMRYRDGGKSAEACPIFFSKKRFELLDGGTFWLSETPEKVSKSWDSWHHRIATFATLKDLVTGKIFTVYNAHPDYREVEIRKNQLAVVAERIKGKESATIVLGDLNAPKEDAALSPFVERLKDSKDFTGETFGATFNGFGSVDSDDALNGIDFIFLPKQAIVEKTGVVKSVPNGVYPSDHFPIFARVRL